MQIVSCVRRMKVQLHVAQRHAFQLTYLILLLVRIFMGQVPLKLNITHGKYAELLHVKDEILAMVSVRVLRFWQC